MLLLTLRRTRVTSPTRITSPMGTHVIVKTIGPRQLCLHSILGLALLSWMSNTGHATIVLDMTTDSDALNLTAGEGLESTGTFSVDGLTISIATESGDGSFNAVGAQGGIGNGGIINDADVLTLSFTGAPFDLISIDLTGVGPSTDDDATVNINGSIFTLETGATDFSGGSDIFMPDPPISLPSGATISFSSTGGNGFGIESITVAAIPEPTAFAFGALVASGVGVVISRRRQA